MRLCQSSICDFVSLSVSRMAAQKVLPPKSKMIRYARISSLGIESRAGESATQATLTGKMRPFSVLPALTVSKFKELHDKTLLRITENVTRS